MRTEYKSRSLRAFLLLLTLFVAAPVGLVMAQSEPASAVGVPAWKRDLVLAGSEIEILPATPKAPVVLRIDAVRRHGSDWRYDIEYYGLEPGSFDLRDYLRRKDGSSLDDLAPIEVEIEGTLAPGVIRPNPLESGELPSVGGYQLRAWILGVLWVIGLWLILSRRRKHIIASGGGPKRVETLADRLRPLVERGLRGELSREASAQLELNLIAFWRKKLGMGEIDSAEALVSLKQHTDAGPLLRQLELWLHSPSSSPEVNLTELLAPYQNLRAEDLESVSEAQRPDVEYA